MKLDLTQAGVGVIQQNANQLELIFLSSKEKEISVNIPVK
jgi:hypothetical protein